MRKSFLASLLIILTILGNAFRVAGQDLPRLLIKNDIPAEELIRKYFVAQDDNLVEIKNIIQMGSPRSIAAFHLNNEYAPFARGILMTTGEADNAIGPNNSSKMGTQMGRPGEAYLTKQTKNVSFDACGLQFDFLAKSDSISFEFFFGSEEYPEYVNRGINDIFAFLFFPDLESAPIDISTIPTGGVPVSIDNINGGKNKHLYLENPLWDLQKLRQWQSTPYKAYYSYGFQYDGFTKSLKTGIKLEPFKWYRIRLIIADVYDNILDSGVFLKAESFKSVGEKKMPSIKRLEDDFKEIRLDSIQIIKEVHAIKTFSKFYFETDSYELKKQDETHLTNLFQLLKEKEYLSCEIIGRADVSGTEDYNQELSEKRAEAVYNFLIEKGIQKKRLTFKGEGERNSVQQANSREKALDRRVELIFTYN